MTKTESNHRLAELSVAEWHALIAGGAGRATSHSYQTNYGNEVRSRMHRSMSELTPEESWLFELNVELCLLREQLTDRHSGYFSHMAAAETMYEIESLLNSELLPEIAAKQRERLLETVAYIRDTGIRDVWSPPAYLDMYVELWIGLLSSAADGHRLFQEELVRLAEGRSTSNKLFPLVARAWMHFWLEEDQEAWRLLEAAERHRLRPEQVFRFLRLLEKTGEWSRLVAWLSHCATDRVGLSEGRLDEYGRYWAAAVERIPEAAEEMWRAITSLLPYSHDLYVKQLASFGHWRQWVDYQLSLGTDPFDYRAKDLQPLEKEAPEALLPFYHQGVEKYVLLRNRKGYKQGVKLLKRLAKLYKKIKREQRWDAYIEVFASRHSRLRALQEELRKGKLIP